MRVLKWDIPVDDQSHQIGSGKVVHVASQYGAIGVVQIWTLESDDPQEVKLTRSVRVYGTGHIIPEDVPTEILGSAIVNKGNLVWHVVEFKK